MLSTNDWNINSTSFKHKESFAPKSNNLKISLAFSSLLALVKRNKIPTRLRKLKSLDSSKDILSSLNTSKKTNKMEFGSHESFVRKHNYENAFFTFYRVIVLFSFKLKKALLISIGLRS